MNPVDRALFKCLIYIVPKYSHIEEELEKISVNEELSVIERSEMIRDEIIKYHPKRFKTVDDIHNWYNRLMKEYKERILICF